MRAAYLHGLRLPQDASEHLLGVPEDRTADLLQCCRRATAFAELQAGKEKTLPPGECDWDGVATGAIRSDPKKTVFTGRFMCFKHRDSKESVLVPLADKTSTKGVKNLGPERFDEVRGPAKKYFVEGMLAMQDGCPALKKALKEVNKFQKVPSAVVIRSRQEYAKQTKFLLSKLPQKLREYVQTKKPKACSKVYYYTLGGDNAAEGWFGNINNCRRRQNLTGRGSTKRAHVNTLSSARLLKAPGLYSVLDALAVYREKMQDSVAPATMFARRGKGSKNDWLGHLSGS